MLSVKVTAVSSRREGPVGAHFVITLLGASGSSKPFEIRDYGGSAQTQNPWQQQQLVGAAAEQGSGPWCSCKVRCQELGQLRQMEAFLEVEGTGPAAAWMLQYVEVQHLGTGQVRQ